MNKALLKNQRYDQQPVSVPRNKYAIISVLLTTLSVIAYFVPGFLDRQYHVVPSEFKILLYIPVAIASTAVAAAILAIVKAHGKWKMLFIFFLFLCLTILAASLLVASLIDAIG